jgi:4-hydroxythreonine-4-phosphate dehydrogenase
MMKAFMPMLITLGDAAGIGPEIIVKAFRDAPEQLQGCVVVGDLAVMQRAARLLAQCELHEPQMHVQLVSRLAEAAQVTAPFTIPVLHVAKRLPW